MKRLVDRPRSTSFFPGARMHEPEAGSADTTPPRPSFSKAAIVREISRGGVGAALRLPLAPALPLRGDRARARLRHSRGLSVRSSPDLPSLGAPHRAVRKTWPSGAHARVRFSSTPRPSAIPASSAAHDAAPARPPSGVASTTVRARPRSRLRVATPRSRPGRARRRASRRPETSPPDAPTELRPLAPPTHIPSLVFFHPLTRARPSPPPPPIPRALTPGRRAAVRRSSGRRLAPLAPARVATEGPASSRAPSGDDRAGAPSAAPSSQGAPRQVLQPFRRPFLSDEAAATLARKARGRRDGACACVATEQCFNVEVTSP